MTIFALALHGADCDRRHPRRQNEQRVHDALCAAGIDSMFLHTLVPIRRRQARRRIETVAHESVPMLPGYGVVRIGDDREAWLRRVMEVTYRVGRRRAIAVRAVLGSIDATEVAPLLALSGRVASVGLRLRLHVGDRVRIITGPLASERGGVIERLNGSRARLMLEGKAVSVPLDSITAEGDSIGSLSEPTT